MKANELMVGDWIDNKKPVKITGVTPTAIRVGSNIGWFKAEEYPPIPITSAIIEANGFDGPVKGSIADYRLYYNNYTWISIYFFGGKWRLEIKVENDPFVSLKQEVLSRRIQFVHELQHALRLMGLSDLADNFKIA